MKVLLVNPVVLKVLQVNPLKLKLDMIKELKRTGDARRFTCFWDGSMPIPLWCRYDLSEDSLA